jgi:hypothetical protein
MKETAKEKLHSFLNIIFYVMVTVNFIVPISLLALCAIALGHLENQHWSIEWAIRVSLCLAIVETCAQIIRTIKLFKKKK